METIALIFLYPLSKSLRKIFQIVQEKKDERFQVYEVDTGAELIQIMEMSKAAIVICGEDKKLIKVQSGHERFFAERRNKLMLTSTKRLSPKEVNALYEKNIQDFFQEPVNEKMLYSKLEFHLKSLETYFKGLARAEEIKKRRAAEEEERKAMAAKRLAEQEAKKAKRDAEAKENANKEKPKRKSLLMAESKLGNERGLTKFQDHISAEEARKLGEDLVTGKLKLVEKTELEGSENKEYHEKNQEGKLDKENDLNALAGDLEKSKLSSMIKMDEDQSSQKITGDLTDAYSSENKNENAKKGFMLESSAYTEASESGKLNAENQKDLNQLASKNQGELEFNEAEKKENKENGAKLEDQELNKLKSNETGDLTFDEESLKANLQKNTLNKDSEKENNQLKGGLDKAELLFTEEEKIKFHQKGKSDSESGDQFSKIEQGKELKSDDESNKIKKNEGGDLTSDNKEKINLNQSGKLENGGSDHTSQMSKSDLDPSLNPENVANLAKSKLNQLDKDSNKLKNSESSALSEEGKKLGNLEKNNEASQKLGHKEEGLSGVDAKSLSNPAKVEKADNLSKSNLKSNEKEHLNKLDVKKSLAPENRDTIKNNDASQLSDPQKEVTQTKEKSAKSLLRDANIKKEEKAELEGDQRSLLKRLEISKKKKLDLFEMADLRYKNYDWNKQFANWETEQEKILRGGKKLQELEKLNKEGKKTVVAIEQEKEAKEIQKDIYHGDLKGLEVAIKILQGINALEQKIEEQTFVFELIGKNIFDRYRALTTFFQKDVKQNIFIPLYSVHQQHNTLWEDYYLKDWPTYSEKKIKDWKNYKYSQVLEFTPQGKIKPESQDSTFEYIFPIDSPKGVIGFAIVHFHQLALTDIETQATELQLELARGYFYRLFHVLSTGKNNGNNQTKAKIEDSRSDDEGSDSKKNPVIDKVIGKIGSLFKWKKAG
ncbi:MAG: hypothetical protein QE271_14605 [Bacteriovoracaceae bacterium]|nr:hypothetical protein [Bacteriovoracaceae bacterium]